MKANDVINCLNVRFAPPAYCLLEQVADGTGARQNRWADAVAMSVWPSRGYDIHGIEVKVSRYDWLSELKKPEKSAAVQQYCNRWWIATPDDTIIQSGELPPTWGWMVTKGTTMRVVREAPVLTPKPVTIEFVASVLRNFSKTEDSMIEQEKSKAYNRGREEGSGHYREEYARLKKSCDEFETASGVRIDKYWGAGKIGEHVATLDRLSGRLEQVAGAIKACDDIRDMLIKVQELAGLKKVVEEVNPSV